ncbi:uncharacterized protein TNCT_235221 [Trichonephila clavata]|uniref:Uncharacterized protein n=1 Tax=Trichonephila clavata TaxID=2740835 RepID=A0A8X6KIK6_TRICU|nr:uncharacterized protein TNCT_235221 [Trichonephila clavata]
MMAEDPTSGKKCLSDSEINKTDSKTSAMESRRTRSSSESYIFTDPEALHNKQENNNKNIFSKQSSSNYPSFETVISSLRNFSMPMKQTSNVDDEIQSATSIGDVSHRSDQLENIEEKISFLEQNNNQQTSKEMSADNKHYSETVVEPSEGNTQQKDNSIDGYSSLQTTSDEYLPSKMEKVIHAATECGDIKSATSSPYQVMKQASINTKALGDNILGEPRCLTLKKYIIDEDDDFELDFEMTTDIEEYDEHPTERQSENSKKSKNQPPDPNDMFLDDDPNEVTEIQSIPYINLASPSKDGKNWEYPVLEREEGELTPDLYSATHSDANESKGTHTKKPPSKESNSEFLNKVNRCFRHLEKEFSNMHVPRGSKRLVTHLRNILCVVERMKRKLSVLIDSASLSSKDNHGRGSSDSKNKAHSSQNSKNSSSKDRERKSNDGTRKTENSHKSHGREFSKENGNPSSSHDSVGIHSKHGESRTKVDNLRRMPISTPYSKVERQRIQSLFKRQMNLITQQIIQQNDQDKHPKSGKHSGAKLKLEKLQQRRPNLEHLTTLEDMENFLELLKTKKGEKITPIDLIQNYQKKQVLKFTTKKKNSTPRTRILPVLLTGSKEDEDVLPVEMIKPKNNPLQVNNSKENEQDGKLTGQICQQKEKLEEKVLRNEEEHELKGILEKQPGKCNSNNSSNTTEFSKSEQLNPKEQKDGKSKTKSEKGNNVSREHSEGIEIWKGESVPSSKDVIDSSSVKRNSKGMKRSETLFHSRASDSERDSREIFAENSKKRISKKYSQSKSSESDSDSQRDQILKKRKRNERDDDSSRKLSSTEPEKGVVSEKKSRTRYRSDVEEVIDGVDEKLPAELRTKKLFIVGDKNLAILDKHFCVKVKGDQIFLKKVGKSRKSRRHQGRRHSSSRQRSEENKETRERKNYKRTDVEMASDSENVGPTLEEMEDFLQQLRAKKIPREKQQEEPLPSLQSREMKFMARIQAKRKAKLMACVSSTPNISEKEAKFLKDLENRSKNPCDSPDTESKKQKLMEKIRAETDYILLSQKQSAILEDDPLSDVKTFLSMIKEAESANDDNSKQFYVSFSLKRSDVKKLENITQGKASALSEESQRLLNSVRAKMRAKKAHVLMVSEEANIEP